MLELALDSRRGSFHLQLECRLDSEWTVVFGSSGAGKSTLLRLIAGLDEPDRGRVTFNGLTLTNSAQNIRLGPGQRNTALVAQQPALFPHMSVAENVGYGLARLEGSARLARVREMLELAGVTDLASRRPRNLSGGESQRVALARALAPMPRLLLLDEPFSNVDFRTAREIAFLLAQMRDKGKTIFVVTHQPALLESIADEFIYMEAGKITERTSKLRAVAQ